MTNTTRLQRGIDEGAGTILIKVNQIGTLSETLDVRLATGEGMVSHLAPVGEAEDTFIADLAVATNAGQIKTGAPCRSERVEVQPGFRIETELDDVARFAGRGVRR